MARLTDEARVKRSLKQFFDANGVWWYMPSTHGMGRSGLADFIALHNGKFWAIEAKGRTKDKTTGLQRLALQQVYDAGGSVAVVDMDNYDDFIERFGETLKFPDSISHDLRREQDREMPE